MWLATIRRCRRQKDPGHPRQLLSVCIRIQLVFRGLSRGTIQHSVLPIDFDDHLWPDLYRIWSGSNFRHSLVVVFCGAAADRGPGPKYRVAIGGGGGGRVVWEHQKRIDSWHLELAHQCGQYSWIRGLGYV